MAVIAYSSFMSVTARSSRSATCVCMPAARHVAILRHRNLGVTEVVGPDPRRQSGVVDQRCHGFAEAGRRNVGHPQLVARVEVITSAPRTGVAIIDLRYSRRKTLALRVLLCLPVDYIAQSRTNLSADLAAAGTSALGRLVCPFARAGAK
jgi:hypothetical protein